MHAYRWLAKYPIIWGGERGINVKVKESWGSSDPAQSSFCIIDDVGRSAFGHTSHRNPRPWRWSLMKLYPTWTNHRYVSLAAAIGSQYDLASPCTKRTMPNASRAREKARERKKHGDKESKVGEIFTKKSRDALLNRVVHTTVENEKVTNDHQMRPSCAATELAMYAQPIPW